MKFNINIATRAVPFFSDMSIHDAIKRRDPVHLVLATGARFHSGHTDALLVCFNELSGGFQYSIATSDKFFVALVSIIVKITGLNDLLDDNSDTNFCQYIIETIFETFKSEEKKEIMVAEFEILRAIDYHIPISLYLLQNQRHSSLSQTESKQT